MTIQMRFEKETPGTLRYQETRDGKPIEPKSDGVIGTLYIRKGRLEGKPAAITVTIETSK